MINDKSNINFFEFLRNRINKTLPGQSAHIEMAPLIEGKLYRTFKPSEDAIICAVLILLFINKTNDKIKVVLTLRSKNIDHSGQISFPGGRSENNESIVETALRENEEEIGIQPNKINVLGKLSQLYVPPSNSLITPIVGYINEPLILKTNSDEVEEAFSVELDDLLDEKNYKRETWRMRNNDIDVPFWNIHSTPLWGATAMMMNELLALYKEFCNHSSDK